MWWGRRRSDGNNDGDVCVMSDATGLLVALDGAGRLRLTTLDQREQAINRDYLGWTDHLFDVPVIVHTTQGDTDMPTMAEFLNTAAYDGGPTISQVLKNLDGGKTATQVWQARVKGQDAAGKPTSVDALQTLADAKTNSAATAALVAKLAQQNGGVDAAELAQQLGPLLTANLDALTDDDVQRIAAAAADEQARRLAGSAG